MTMKFATMTVAAVALCAAALSALPAAADNWRPAAYQADRSGIVVSQLRSPQVLQGRMVQDRSGRPLGRVVSISLDREGKAEMVNIEVGGLLNLGKRVMPFAADRIVYYPADAKLVASNEPPQIRAPQMDPRSPTQASMKRQAPSPTIIRN